jgi:hypothetical protein
MSPTESCDGHDQLAAELRELAVGALDRLGPLLDRLRSGPPTSGGERACVGCPVCAVVAVLRGDRPELAVRLAEHASGLVAVLRAALEEGAGAPGGGAGRTGPGRAPYRGGSPAGEPAASATEAGNPGHRSGRTVQRIPVVRTGTRR